MNMSEIHHLVASHVIALTAADFTRHLRQIGQLPNAS